MTLNEIIAGIRRDTREPSPLTAADTYITEIVYRGLNLLWDALILSDKAFGKKRAALSSDTNVFTVPDDCRTVLNVWDMRTNAKDITGATNASPIVVTSAAHGYTDDAIITISGITGNTAANGVWKVASAATDTFELYGSTGDGAYVSGGKLYQESNAYTLLTEVAYREVYYTNRYEYYMEKGKININNRTFTNDLVLDYEKFASDDITN
ncbi:MAG: hypothetical protein JRC86_06935, partial [Deltaproteobacteria bacterium]|nr:hypothetical protein [Deltaproteobacteria bacterium]